MTLCSPIGLHYDQGLMAIEAGKPIRELETVEQQLDMLAELSPELQEHLLLDAVYSSGESAGQTSQPLGDFEIGRGQPAPGELGVDAGSERLRIRAPPVRRT